MTGFIGCGNMACAIIRGLVSSGKYSGEDIAVFDICEEKAKELSEECGVRVFKSENQIVQNCSQVILAVKPVAFPMLLKKISSDVENNDPLIISIAAGKTTDYIASLLNSVPRLIRVMPNINAKVGEAVSAFCGNERATEDDLAFAEKFCNCFGRGLQIEEKLFSIYSAIGGCSPAFVFMFIDSIARAAVKNGMTKKQALETAAQAVYGSAKLILESDEHPWQLVDAVCSPGGTTIEGVCALQENGFESAVEKAVQASFEKDKKL